MEWWDDLWLSEGFTSYMEHIGIDLIDPNLNAVRFMFLNILLLFQYHLIY